jgi:hypothetical protein
LLGLGYTTGAVYLAGYGIECILKSLILVATPAKNRAGILGSFRGGRAHDYEWLRGQYLSRGGARLPSDITRQFILANDWSTELRYVPRQVRGPEAEIFLKATDAILTWADGRL